MKRLIVFLLLCSTVFAQDKTNTTEAPKKSKGKITGKVLGDDGQPMDGAIAQINTTSNSNTRGWEPIVTDEEGNFVAENLSPGSYTVGAYARGFVIPDTTDLRKYYHPGDAVTLILVKGGVITGRVTNTLGEPVIAAPIQVTRIRDREGRKVTENGWYGQNRKTDDKGNYRIYGLPAGKYLVAAGGKNVYSSGPPDAFNGLIPTFYPSASRDAATEVTVNLSEEVSGINIRLRGEKGVSISGKVVGGLTGLLANSINIRLQNLPGNSLAESNFIYPQSSSRDFSMHGIADGEYQILADYTEWGQNQKDAYRSAPRKITVKGANISNLVLTLLPLSSVEGKIEVAENSDKNRPAECKSSRTSLPEEIVASLRREPFGKDADSDPDNWVSSDAPNEKGEVKYFNLEPARYRVTAVFPDETWYIKSVTMKSASAVKSAAAKTASPGTVDVGKLGLSLSSGEKIKDLLISVTDGAANVKGRVITDPNKILPPRLRVFLVPAEKESLDDLLRYYEVKTKNGAFTFENLAPGKYLMMARPIPETESDELPQLRQHGTPHHACNYDVKPKQRRTCWN